MSVDHTIAGVRDEFIWQGNQSPIVNRFHNQIYHADTVCVNWLKCSNQTSQNHVNQDLILWIRIFRF
jgi:hypothetical protein